MEITRIDIVLDKRYKLRAPEFPVAIRVNFHSPGKQVNPKFSTGKFYTLKEFRRIKGGALEADRFLWDQLEAFKKKAQGIKDRFGSMTPFEFKQQWKGVKSSAAVCGYLESKITELKSADRSHYHFEQCLRHIQKYSPELRFAEITEKWLSEYWRSHGKALMDGEDIIRKALSVNTRSRVLRALKAAYNEARRSKVFTVEVSPFERFKIPTEKKLKIPLTSEDVEVLKGEFYNNTDPKENWGVAMWLFSNQANGMNPLDMALLKRAYLNKIEGFLVYKREKTINTETKVEEIAVPLNQLLLDIIARYGKRSLSPDDFVFPILPEKQLTYIERKKTIDQFCKLVKKWVNKVGQRKGIRKFSFAIARHTYSNNQLNQGTDLSVLQYNLGHADPKTTLIYANSFKLDVLKKAGEKR